MRRQADYEVLSIFDGDLHDQEDRSGRAGRAGLDVAMKLGIPQ
jgi:hypothetical protein